MADSRDDNEVEVTERASAFFLTVEGGEGVGKSSFCRIMQQRLQAVGCHVVLTREPGGTEMADRIRALFLNPPTSEPLSTEAELFLVSAARSQHVRQKIKPCLEQGEWVLCDRFYDSSRVYQGLIGGVSESALETCLQLSVDDCHPDISFFLDCPVEIALQRLGQRNEQQTAAADFDNNRFDQADVAFHKKLRQAFLDLARRFPGRAVVLDASAPTEQIVDQAWRQLKQRGLLGGRA